MDEKGQGQDGFLIMFTLDQLEKYLNNSLGPVSVRLLNKEKIFPSISNRCPENEDMMRFIVYLKPKIRIYKRFLKVNSGGP